MADKDGTADLPHYSPEADAKVRAGSGTDFGADLYYLFRAGRIYFPQAASDYYDLTVAAHRTGPGLRDQTARCGNPTVLTQLIELRDELQEAMRRTTTSLSKVGPALVTVAESFARTDEAAAGEFKRLYGQASGLYENPIDPPPAAPRNSDPQPDAPGRGNHGSKTPR